jgi:hypothetical protein
VTNFDYTSRDYSSIQTDLLARASRVIPEWTSRDASDFGMVMVDLWSYMGDVLHYYVDRAAGESYLETATQRDSVLAIAALMDYLPNFRLSATGSVVIDITDSIATDSAPVLIPKNTRMIASPKNATASPIIFLTTANIAIKGSSSTPYVDPSTNETYITYVKSNDQITIPVIEGEVYEEFYSATGLPNQQIILSVPGVVNSSITVQVAEGSNSAYITYAPVERLIEATSSQKVYYTTVTAEDRTVVVFGNGINGIIPTTNAQVLVSYRRSRGAAGNVPAYSINGFESTILSNGSSLSGIIVVGNTSSTAGGSDSESMASMKANIPLSFRTQDRAVSVQDFRDLALKVSGVSKAVAVWDSVNSEVDLKVVGPQGDYGTRTLAQNSISVDTALTASVSDYLAPRAVVGVNYNIAGSVSLQSVKVTTSINVLDGYVRQRVESAVRDTILELFTFDNVSFGQSVSLGELYRAILGVAGVDYATVTRFTTGTTTVIDGNSSFQGVTANASSLLYIAFDSYPSISSTGGITGTV